MNIRDMARKAGVSVATISRAINQETRHRVAPRTLKKIDDLVRKHAYTPNLSARNLNKTSTKTIGILFPYFYSIFYHSYYINILAGVADALIHSDYHFKIMLVKEGSEKWDHYNFQKGEHIDGLLVTHWPQFFSNKAILEKINIPCVVVSDYVKDANALFVCGDQVQGGRQAAEYLYGLGHRRFAVFSGSVGSIDGELRLQGFRDYLNSKGIVLDNRLIIRGDYREDIAYQSTDGIFKGAHKPTAVFCLNDRMALGVMRKLKEMKIKCPKDVSVIGFDNDPQGKENQPALTTVNVPLYDLASEGTRRILSHLKSAQSTKSLVGQVIYPTELVIRSSVQKSF